MFTGYKHANLQQNKEARKKERGEARKSED